MSLSEQDYRDLAASSDLTTARGGGRLDRQKIPPGAWVMLGLVGLGFFWFITRDTAAPPRLTDPDTEQFSPPRGNPPIVPPEQAREPEGERVEMTPDTPPSPPPPIVSPAAPPTPAGTPDAPPPIEPPAPAGPMVVPPAGAPAAADDGNDEEEARRWERLRSPMIALNGSPPSSAEGGQDAAAGAAVIEETDGNANVAFLNRQARQGVDVAVAGKIARPDAYIVQGTLIRGVLETAIQSDLPGSVRAVVSEDVWSLDGRRILIPRGSRLIGEYSSAIARGQTRVLIAWNRVVRSDGVSIQLGSIGTDSLGRSGLAGEVDNKYLQRFGSALLLTVVGGVAQYVAGLGDRSTPSQTITIVDPVTGAVTTTTIDGDDSRADAREIAARTAAQAIQQMAQEALRDSIGIAPTIHVDQGERIMVLVRRDLDFSALYRDPVQEKLRELRTNRNAYK